MATQPVNRIKITEIAKEFAEPFANTVGPINGSGWLIVDPLSGYLNMAGYTNTPMEYPANDKHPQVLVLEFEDGSRFIPAGADFKVFDPCFENYMWLDKE